MKTLIFAILTVSSWNAYSDDWFCKHEAGKRENGQLWACGIGESMEEASARKNALKDAYREFESICEISSDCDEKRVTVDPQRTTCQPYNGHWKCYRLLVVTLKQ